MSWFIPAVGTGVDPVTSRCQFGTGGIRHLCRDRHIRSLPWSSPRNGFPAAVWCNTLDHPVSRSCGHAVGTKP